MNFEVDPVTGAMAMTKARRWWCELHREGRESDLEPYVSGPRLGYSPSGAIIDLDEAEADADREVARAARRGVERAARRAEREAVAEELAAVRRAEREQLEREAAPGSVLP
jgi:hypothetical protein